MASTVSAADSAGASEKEIVARAYRKVMAGKDLTKNERRAVKRHEKEQEERLRWKFYETIPQKHWAKLSGRQAKVINEQAQRYGIPFSGATVNLPAVARAIHDFLAANAVKLAEDDDPLLQGGGSPALERYREEKAALARLDRLERERTLVPRDEIREGLGLLASMLRGVGETLQRQFGPVAGEILNEVLDEMDREIIRRVGDANGSLEDSDGY